MWNQPPNDVLCVLEVWNFLMQWEEVREATNSRRALVKYYTDNSEKRFQILTQLFNSAMAKWPGTEAYSQSRRPKILSEAEDHVRIT